MVSITSFKSPSIWHQVLFINYGSISRKIDDKAGEALGWGWFVVEGLLLFSVKSTPKDWFQKVKAAMAKFQLEA